METPPKLNCFHVAFTNGTKIHRWRKIPRDEACDEYDAIHKCLLQLKKGAIQRLERRKKIMHAHVAKPGTICHANGMPMMSQGYQMSFGPES